MVDVSLSMDAFTIVDGKIRVIKQQVIKRIYKLHLSNIPTSVYYVPKETT